jgi:predicted permease
MTLWSRLTHWWRQLVHGARADRELDEEMRAWVQLATDERVRAGARPDEARRAALIEAGGIEQIKEGVRDARGTAFLDVLRQDLRFGIRQAVRAPGFSLAAVVALALGIGATAATFSVVDAVLLRPLDYADPERLVVVMHDRTDPVSPRNYFAWKREAVGTFASMEAAEWWMPNLSGPGDPEKVYALRVTPGMLSMLGIAPAHGHPLSALDEDAREVVISHGLWLRRFGGQLSAIGRDIPLDGELHTIVGVMPAPFRFAPFWATQAEMWGPLPLAGRATSGAESLRVFARLGDGMALAAARDRMTAIAAELERQAPGTNRDVTVTPLEALVVGDVRQSVLIVFAAVGFVLLVACVNVAHMLLARATARGKEIAVRAALGAGRRRIVRQLLTESLLLSFAGGAAGVLLARAAIGTLKTLAGPAVPRIELAGLDGRVLAFAVVVSVLTGLTFGLAPVFKLFRPDLTTVLGASARGSSSGRGTRRARGVLMASEIAMAVALLIGAGLMLRSFAGLRAVDPGWDPGPVLSMSVSVAGTAESPEGRRVAFYQALTKAVRALPGVTQASAINHVPLAGDVWTHPFQIDGRPEPPPGEEPSAAFRVVLSGYFETMGLGLVSGRGIEARDTRDAAGVVVINERLAELHWPGENPIGQRMSLPGARELTVIGVVRNAFIYDWAEPPAPELYVAFLQNARYRSGPAAHYAYMSLVARTEGDPAALESSIRGLVRSLAPDVTVSDILPLGQVVTRSTAGARFLMSLLGVFAGIALALAAVGVYGVTSYDVAARRREIGIRLAMGAAPRQVLGQVLAGGLGVVAAGLAAGLVAAWMLSGLLAGTLYGVEPTDPAVFALAAASLGAVALVANLIPCWRATRTNPMAMLGR